MTDLTPEAEDFIANLRGAMTLEREIRPMLAAIEQAAVARDRAGLVEVVARGLAAIYDHDDWPVPPMGPQEMARRILAIPEAQS
jgi:hypothetical protein